MGEIGSDRNPSRIGVHVRAGVTALIAMAALMSTMPALRAGQVAAHPGVTAAKPPVRLLSVPGAQAGIPLYAAAIRGDSVTFAFGYSGDGLYVGRLHHWAPKLVGRSRPEPLVTMLKVSQHWLAWGASAGLKWAVVAMDRRTRKLYTVDSSTKEGLWTPPYDLPRISLTGATVAWNYFRCVSRCGSSKRVIKSVIAIERLPAGPRRIVRVTTGGRCDSVWPSLWRKVLVWHQEGICNGHAGSDVMMANLSTGKVKQVTRNHGASEAVTNGRYVAWEQGAPGSSRFTDGGRMVVLDLATGKRVVAATPPQQKCKPCTGVDAPVMSNQILAWRFVTGGSIFARDLATGKDYLASPPGDDLAGLPDGAWGKRIVWGDCRQPRRYNGCFADIAVATIP